MQIRLARDLMFDSIVDGPGLRIVIWTQGCFFNCPKCHNPQTHDPKAGEAYDTEDLIKRILAYPLVKYGGVTLSGGDPFLQKEAILEIARALHKEGINIWAYSGDTFEHMMDDHNPNSRIYKEIFENINVLVDGPYVDALRNLDLEWRGSENQRLIDVPNSLKEGKVVLFKTNN